MPFRYFSLHSFEILKSLQDTSNFKVNWNKIKSKKFTKKFTLQHPTTTNKLRKKKNTIEREISKKEQFNLKKEHCKCEDTTTLARHAPSVINWRATVNCFHAK